MKAKSSLIIILILALLALTACSGGAKPAGNEPVAPAETAQAPMENNVKFSFWESSYLVEKWMNCTAKDTAEQKCIVLCLLQMGNKSPITFQMGGNDGKLTPTLQFDASLDGVGSSTMSWLEQVNDVEGYAVRYNFFFMLDKDASLPTSGTFTFLGDGSTHALDMSALSAPSEDFVPESTAAAEPTPEPAAINPELDARLGGEWTLKEVEFSTGEEANNIFDINATLGLEEGFEHGLSLKMTALDASVFAFESDMNFAACIKAMSDLPFEAPEVDFTQYERYTLSPAADPDNLVEGSGMLEPSGPELKYVSGDDSLRLTYSGDVEVPERDVNGMTAKGGTIQLTLTFVFAR